jgi:hypothetical protein
MNIKEIKKDLPPISEICNYYGQKYENIKHMKIYLNSLIEQYIDENYCIDNDLI